MTEQDLAAIEARANAATAGPWEATHQYYACWSLDGPEANGPDMMPEGDATFIANARTDVPALVAELKAYRRALLDACGDLAGQAGGTAESWAAKLVADARADLAA
jgi:hypothetical protein